MVTSPRTSKTNQVFFGRSADGRIVRRACPYAHSTDLRRECGAFANLGQDCPAVSCVFLIGLTRHQRRFGHGDDGGRASFLQSVTRAALKVLCFGWSLDEFYDRYSTHDEHGWRRKERKRDPYPLFDHEERIGWRTDSCVPALSRNV